MGDNTGFIEITNDGHRITSAMPNDETVVDVMLRDGSVTRAWYSRDIMERGDWDFVLVDEDGEPDGDADSIAAEVVAWRHA